MFKRFWWVFLVMIPVGALGGLLFAAVVTYVMPKKYESEAVIQVPPLLSMATPQFFGTEFEKIKSRNSLGKVVDHLELTVKWGLDRETAIRVLKGIVTTQNIRGTDLISIRVRHTSKDDTRDIAAGIASVYQEQRAEAAREGRQRDLAEVNKAVSEQEQKVEKRRKALAGTMELSHPLHGLPALKQPEYIEAKRDFEAEQAVLQSLKLKKISGTLEDARDSVIIHEEPQIPQLPISPNVTLNLVLGAALGLLLSPLMALPVILLLGRFVPQGR